MGMFSSANENKQDGGEAHIRDVEANESDYPREMQRSYETSPTKDVPLWRMLVAEFVGTMLLTATMVGAGIQGLELSNGNAAFALLAMSLATWAILFAIISVFDTVSQGHFNPIVSIAEALRLEKSIPHMLLFIVVQVVGAIMGTLLAHGMFNRTQAAAFDGISRNSGGEYLGEVVATFVLLVVNFGAGKKNVAMALSLGVLAGYWFTSSQCFANPAATIGRMFTDSFAGINPGSVLVYLGGQVTGMVLALLFTHFIIDGRSTADLAKVRKAC